MPQNSYGWLAFCEGAQSITPATKNDGCGSKIDLDMPGHCVFVALWLRSPLRPTAPYAFSTTSLPALWSWDHFSEPTFWPSGTHRKGERTWKTHSVSRGFYLFAHFDMFSIYSLLSDSSHNCCCTCPLVGSLASQPVYFKAPWLQARPVDPLEIYLVLKAFHQTRVSRERFWSRLQKLWITLLLMLASSGNTRCILWKPKTIVQSRGASLCSGTCEAPENKKSRWGHGGATFRVQLLNYHPGIDPIQIPRTWTCCLIRPTLQSLFRCA